MRILLVTTGLKIGGAEHQVAALAQEFQQMGHAVAILSLSAGREIDLPTGVDVIELNMRKTPAGMAQALWFARGLVKSWRPDVIHAHMVHANLFARWLTRIVHCPPLVCTAHSFREGGRLRMLAYRLTDRWSALTTHVSEDGRGGMVASGAAQADRIAVMPNGIDIDRFHPNAALRGATRARLGISAGTRLALNVGRLVPEKAQDLLLRAFAQIDPATLPVHLLIAGGGPLHQSLTAQIAALGLASRVTLLGPRDDVPALLNAADTFALSSDIEGLPMVLVEALACGCPVVATDAPGVREVLHDQGSIVPRDDATALAAALDAALRHGRGLPTEESVRRAHVVAKFSIDAVAQRWLEIYASLIGAAATPRTEAV
ncbi:glycosyltransferase [Cupriavidus sp. Met-2]|jgi:glycosyltransferase involved in cell wall biosynthesis|uniref:glycosyltransferase n=2 Tax=Burkholderiaceae TaxID=119060 RepID=UPI001E422D6D|nr:glycosyltransferase [Cupriavidus metallidurans]MDE4919152.1 glycosyltransferase [Cupriavidus metallidurans]